MNMNNYNGVINYDNPEVLVIKPLCLIVNLQRIREELGEFDYGREEGNLGRRESRQLVSLENGARYQGEWYDLRFMKHVQACWKLGQTGPGNSNMARRLHV